MARRKASDEFYVRVNKYDQDGNVIERYVLAEGFTEELDAVEVANHFNESTQGQFPQERAWVLFGTSHSEVV